MNGHRCPTIPRPAGGFLALLALVACAPDIPEPDLGAVEPGILAAVREAQEAVKASPGSAEAWGVLGDRYRAHGWPDPSIACYRRAQEIEPEAFIWPYLIGDILSFNEPEAAVEHFERALSFDSEYAPGHVRFGNLLAKLGRNQDAREHFEEALRLRPEFAHAWLGLGQIDITESLFEEGREKLQRAVSLHPSLGEAHSALATALLSLGDKQTAERHAELGRKLPAYTPFLDPRQARPVTIAGSKDYNQRGEELLASGDIEGAREHFDEALRNNPDHIAARKNLGLLLMETGEHAEAEPHLRRALEQNPDLPRAQMALGIVLAQRGEFAEAEGHLRQAVLQGPRAAEAHYNLGTLLAKTGRLDEAIETFSEAIRLQPGNLGARANLALALSASGRHAEAEEELRKALRMAPGEPRLTQLLGEILARQRATEG